jgi:hypothetical protein
LKVAKFFSSKYEAWPMVKSAFDVKEPVLLMGQPVPRNRQGHYPFEDSRSKDMKSISRRSVQSLKPQSRKVAKKSKPGFLGVFAALVSKANEREDSLLLVFGIPPGYS